MSLSVCVRILAKVTSWAKGAQRDIVLVLFDRQWFVKRDCCLFSRRVVFVGYQITATQDDFCHYTLSQSIAYR
jgi:hypothetical protein